MITIESPATTEADPKQLYRFIEPSYADLPSTDTASLLLAKRLPQ